MDSFLNQINHPDDLKKVPLEDLPRIAKEIRAVILKTVSERGGHLGASLGAVELTIALHRVFDTPKDRIIWDVGHQGYPHKLLTGRRDRFATLRQHKGISGFLSRSESEFDAFGAGHAGTSISAALGMAEARDQQGKNHHVIAIIGDGSMTAGMAYEALNHAGALKRNLIVILNDNEMSISKNVGAFSAYLNRILTSPFYTKFKSETMSMLKNIPKIGPPMLEVARRAEESVKGMIVPGILFEELGFRYIGPIDGHEIDHLLTTFENIKKLSGPILIHVVTKKGKGYAQAEADPVGFHGMPSFHLSTGQAKKAPKGPPSYTSVFSKSLIKLAQEDQNIVAITAAMPEGTGLTQFSQVFPNRFYDVGISEQHAVTMAAGMAAEGLRPVVAIYSTFLQRAFDQIVHDVAIQNLPVVFCLDRAGIVGEDGATHTGAFDISYLRGIPNMTLMAPKDENELQHMLATALKQQGPVAIRYPRGSGLGVSLDEVAVELPVGKGEIVYGAESKCWDLAFIAMGNMVQPAEIAALALAEQGIKVGLVNARFAKPIDRALLVSIAARCSKIVTLEEQALAGGFGDAVLGVLEEERVSGNIPAVSVRRVGLPDYFLEHGPQKVIRKEIGLDPESIAKMALLFAGEQSKSSSFKQTSKISPSVHVKIVR